MRGMLILVTLIIFFVLLTSCKDNQDQTKTTSKIPTDVVTTTQAVTTTEDTSYESVKYRKVDTLKFYNQINIIGPDPFVTSKEGYYYFTRTLGSRIDLWRSRTLSGIDLGERKTVYIPSPGLKEIWAPELHFIAGKWYLYFTANTGCGDSCRGIYVLENENDNPLEGEWVNKGKVNTKYAGLDGTVFEHNGEHYFIYAAYGNWSGAHGSSLSIAKMLNPWTLTGEETILTHPEYSWEKQGMHVNEGAVIIKNQDKVHLVYSASACWVDGYSLGVLTTTNNKDVLVKDNWHKSTEPIFRSSATNGVFGPGHNFFVKTKDGKEDWIIFHGNNYPGQGCGHRPSRLQKVNFDETGNLILGEPLKGELTVPSGDYRIDLIHTIGENISKNPIENTYILNEEASRVIIKDINVPEQGVYSITLTYRNHNSSKLRITVNNSSSINLDLPSSNNEFVNISFNVLLNKGYRNEMIINYLDGITELKSLDIDGEVDFKIEHNQEYIFINPSGGKAVKTSAIGFNIITWDYQDNDLSFRFKFYHLGNNIYRIEHVSTKKALAVIDKNMNTVRLMEYQDLNTQKWELVHLGYGLFKFKNVGTNKVLDISGASIDIGASVHTWDDVLEGTAQIFRIYPVN